MRFLAAVSCVIYFCSVAGGQEETSSFASDYTQNTINNRRTFYNISERASPDISPRRMYRRRPYTNPMPECASQQVCNAMFMRLKFIQPLCRCPKAYDQCSTRTHPYDGRTVNLISDRDGLKTQTLVKVCEDVTTVRTCSDPHDWMLLALQNVRTGRAHYLVVCQCPPTSVMEGPVLHTNPPYARIPGISVYGMLCVQGARKSRLHKEDYPPVPWDKVYNLYNSTLLAKSRKTKFRTLL